MATPVSYHDSLEKDRAAYKALQAASQTASASGDADITAALAELDAALDSKEIALAMRKPVARRVLMAVRDGKVGAGDLVKLMGMIADRVDGKVADVVKAEGSLLPSSIEISFVSPQARLSDRGVIEATSAAHALIAEDEPIL